MSDSMRENKPNDLLSTCDAAVWAKRFCETTGFADEGWALSWFANAIMTGYDVATRKAADIAGAHNSLIAEEISPGWLQLRELRRDEAHGVTT